jgi:PAS domain S-box-containing protein
MQPTVLIVDDDRSHLLALSRLLQANGYKAVTADDGAEGLALFVEQSPHVVLLDAIMPGMDGLEVCTRIRALPNGATVPIVILTSLEDEESIDRFFAGGATDYVIKPIRLKLLLHRVRVLAEMQVSARAFSEESALLRAFFRANPLAAFILRLPDGVIVEVNDTFLAEGRTTREAVIGRRTDELPGLTDRQKRAEALAAIQEGRTPYSYETQLNMPGGLRDVMVVHERFDVNDRQYSAVVIYDLTQPKKTERALTESKRQLEEVTSGIPGVVYQYRRLPNGWEGFDFVNVGTEAVFGVSPAEMYADPHLVWTFIHPDDVPALQASAAKSWEELAPWSHDCRIVARSGALRWVRIQSRPRVADDGAIVWSGILIDVTERKRIEEELAASTARLEEVTSAMPGVVYRHRQLRDGRQFFDYISQGTEDLFGVKAEDVRRDASALWGTVLPSDFAGILESIDHTFETLTPWRREFRVVLPSGEERWISGQSVPFRQDADTLICTGLFTDCTDRKRMEVALRESERRFEQFFKTTPIPAVILDFPTGKLVDVNTAWEAANGHTRAEALGKTTGDLNLYVDVEQREDVWRNLREGRTPVAFECRYRRKDGDIRFGEVIADRFEAGGVLYAISLIRDVTDQRRAERELRESREKFEKFFQATSLACSIQSFETERIIEVNDAMLRLTGKPREEVVGYTSRELDFFADPREREALWKEFRSGKMPHSGEFRFRVQWGGQRIGAMLWDIFEVGGEKYLFTMIQDITDQRRAERELREKEEKFTKFFQATSLACTILSYDTERILDINEAMRRMSGFTMEEAIGHTTAELNFYANPADRENVWRLWREGQFPYVGELEFRVKSGEIRTGEVVVGLFEAGGEKYLFSIIQDVTERKRMETALRENEARFAKFFQTTPLPAMIVDVGTRKLVAANDELCAVSGFAREEILGRTSAELGMFVDAGQYDAVWRRILARDTPYTYEGEFRIKTGEHRLGSVVIEMFESGGRWYTMSIIRDVTAQRQLEGERIRIAKLEGLNLLAGGVAHDFNNLLAAILGNIELLRTQFGFESDGLTNRLNAIERAGKRAKSLAAQLLMLAKDTEPLAETVGLPPLMTDAMTFIVQGSAVSLTFSFPEDGLPLVHADPTQIEQVFQNLAVNACDAMPDGGDIRVVGETVSIGEASGIPLESGTYVRLAVSDTGRGIAPEALDRIFDPYFTTKKHGSGLGLALVHAIVTKHRGYVRVVSPPGRGATFELYFPTPGCATGR